MQRLSRTPQWTNLKASRGPPYCTHWRSTGSHSAASSLAEGSSHPQECSSSGRGQERVPARRTCSHWSAELVRAACSVLSGQAIGRRTSRHWTVAGSGHLCTLKPLVTLSQQRVSNLHRLQPRVATLHSMLWDAQHCQGQLHMGQRAALAGSWCSASCTHRQGLPAARGVSYQQFCLRTPSDCKQATWSTWQHAGLWHAAAGAAKLGAGRHQRGLGSHAVQADLAGATPLEDCHQADAPAHPASALQSGTSPTCVHGHPDCDALQSQAGASAA